MELKKTLGMLVILWLTTGLSAATTIEAVSFDDPTFGSFTFVNNTGGVVYDLETGWSGTGGTLSNGVITGNGGPGKATIVANLNMVTVTWDDGGLKANGSVAFKMDSQASAVFAGGNWTGKNGQIIGPAVITDASPEPASIFLLTIGMLPVGFAYRRRLRGKLSRLEQHPRQRLIERSRIR